MIKYKIIKNNLDYKIEVKGHANQNPYGSDIVCASVSTMLVLTINLLEKLGLNCCNVSKPIFEEGYALIHINMTNDTAIKILDNLQESLDMLKLTYPKNIKSEK